MWGRSGGVLSSGIGYTPDFKRKLSELEARNLQEGTAGWNSGKLLNPDEAKAYLTTGLRLESLLKRQRAGVEREGVRNMDTDGHLDNYRPNFQASKLQWVRRLDFSEADLLKGRGFTPDVLCHESEKLRKTDKYRFSLVSVNDVHSSVHIDELTTLLLESPLQKMKKPNLYHDDTHLPGESSRNEFTVYHATKLQYIRAILKDGLMSSAKSHGVHSIWVNQVREIAMWWRRNNFEKVGNILLELKTPIPGKTEDWHQGASWPYITTNSKIQSFNNMNDYNHGRAVIPRQDDDNYKMKLRISKLYVILPTWNDLFLYHLIKTLTYETIQLALEEDDDAMRARFVNYATLSTPPLPRRQSEQDNNIPWFFRRSNSNRWGNDDDEDFNPIFHVTLAHVIQRNTSTRVTTQVTKAIPSLIKYKEEREKAGFGQRSIATGTDLYRTVNPHHHPIPRAEGSSVSKEKSYVRNICRSVHAVLMTRLTYAADAGYACSMSDTHADLPGILNSNNDVDLFTLKWSAELSRVLKPLIFTSSQSKEKLASAWKAIVWDCVPIPLRSFLIMAVPHISFPQICGGTDTAWDSFSLAENCFSRKVEIEYLGRSRGGGQSRSSRREVTTSNMQMTSDDDDNDCVPGNEENFSIFHGHSSYSEDDDHEEHISVLPHELFRMRSLRPGTRCPFPLPFPERPADFVPGKESPPHLASRLVLDKRGFALPFQPIRQGTSFLDSESRSSSSSNSATRTSTPLPSRWRTTFQSRDEDIEWKNPASRWSLRVKPWGNFCIYRQAHHHESWLPQTWTERQRVRQRCPCNHCELEWLRAGWVCPSARHHNVYG